MTELEHDPLLQMILAMQADVKSLLERELTRYVTGTWTAAFANTGGGTPGVYTYSNQQGFYTRLESVVFIWGRCEITAIGTPPVGATMSISGLPFTSSNAGSAGAVAFASINHFNYSAAALSLNGQIGLGATAIDLRESFDAGATVQVPAANFTDTACALRFAGMYLLP